MVFSVDWLEASIWAVPRQEVERVLSGYIKFGFVLAERGNAYYKHQLAGPGGAAIMWSEDRDEIHIQLKGEICQSMSEGDMRGLLLWLLTTGGKASRVDLAGDDFARRVRAKDVWAALEQGDYSSHIQQGNWTRNETLHGGMTVYGGGKQSRQKVRVYDKEEESGGLVPATRWELELRDEAAQSMLKRLPTRRWGMVWAERLVQMVDFKDRAVDEKPSRCPRLPWFESLVGSASKEQGVYTPKPVQGLDRVRKWYRRACAASTATIVMADGGDMTFVIDTAKCGESRMKSKHWVMLEAASGKRGDEG